MDINIFGLLLAFVRSMKKKIAVFASGSGSNAQKIMEYFRHHPTIEVAIVLTNNPDAYVLQRADNFEIPTHVFDRRAFYETSEVVSILQNLEVDVLVLAGFLWLVPASLLHAFPERILNIHPALLPAYGGKGMYGDRVHLSVKEAGETETGITIHRVNERFDEGEIVFQSRVRIQPDDTLDIIRFKVQQLEHTHYPKVIEQFIRNL